MISFLTTSQQRSSAAGRWALILSLAILTALAFACPSLSASAQGQTVAKASAKTATTKAKAAKTATKKKSKKSSKAKKAPASQATLEQRLAEIERKAEAKAKVQRELDARLAALEADSEEDLLERIDAGEALDLEMVGDTFWHSLGGAFARNPLYPEDELPETAVVGPLADGMRNYEIPSFASRYAFPLGVPPLDPSRTLPSITPVKGKSYYISSHYGPRKNPKRRRGIAFHGGVDIAGPFKTPIIAAADGIVEASRFQKGYGNVVWVRHREGLVTGYAHLTKRVAKPGQFVNRGDVLGYMGRTGRATGVHLHYAVLNNGRFVDPFPFLGQDLTAKADASMTWTEPSAHEASLLNLVKSSLLGTPPEVEFQPLPAALSQTSGTGAQAGDAAPRAAIGPLASLSATHAAGLEISF